MVVLGGMGSILGVILGAVVLIILPESLRGFQNYRMLIFGGAMAAMMLLRPQGIIGNIKRKLELHPEDEKILKQETESLYDVEKNNLLHPPLSPLPSREGKSSCLYKFLSTLGRSYHLYPLSPCGRGLG